MMLLGFGLTGWHSGLEENQKEILNIEMRWNIRLIMIGKRGNMKKDKWVAMLMVMSIPSLALASVGSDPVPEPTSMLFFGAGLIGMAIMRKKYKNKRVKKAKK